TPTRRMDAAQCVQQRLEVRSVIWSVDGTHLPEHWNRTGDLSNYCATRLNSISKLLKLCALGCGGSDYSDRTTVRHEYLEHRRHPTLHRRCDIAARCRCHLPIHNNRCAHNIGEGDHPCSAAIRKYT